MLFLGLGIMTGSVWAYRALGWGGYWAWDPIENIALVPWLLLCAYSHINKNKLAKQNGVTPQQVREDMAQAIRQAYENPKDEQTKWFQKQVPCKGQIPTPEEMMDFVSQYCSENENQTFFVS